MNGDFRGWTFFMLAWGAEGILGGHDFFLRGFGGARFLWKKFGGGARFFVYNYNPKKNYIIFFIYRYSGIIFCPFILFPDFPIILFPESGQYDVIVLHHDWWKS